MKKAPLWAGVGLCLLFCTAMPICGEPLRAAFTYQGQLEELGSPATGVFDFRIVAFDSLEFGSQVSPVVIFDDVEVLGGLVNLEVEFGEGVFRGERRWVQIEMRDGASVGSFTTLLPRQEIIPSPYSLYAKESLFAKESQTIGGDEIESGTIGDCLSNGSGGSSGSVVFRAPFVAPPRVLMQVDESFNDSGCIATRLTARTTTGFSWKAFGTSSSIPCDCYHWLAIGRR